MDLFAFIKLLWLSMFGWDKDSLLAAQESRSIPNCHIPTLVVPQATDLLFTNSKSHYQIHTHTKSLERRQKE